MRQSGSQYGSQSYSMPLKMRMGAGGGFLTRIGGGGADFLGGGGGGGGGGSGVAFWGVQWGW